MKNWTCDLLHYLAPLSLVDRRVDSYSVSHRCGSSLAWVTSGKAKFLLRMVRWFFSRFSGFCLQLMNDRLDTSEIFLKGHKTPDEKNKTFCIKMNEYTLPIAWSRMWTHMTFCIKVNTYGLLHKGEWNTWPSALRWWMNTHDLLQ